MHTAEFKFSNFVIEYLGEIETKSENIYACLSVAWMGSNQEKNGGWKSRDTLPLTWLVILLENTSCLET